MNTKELKTRISGLRAAVKYLTRTSGKTAKLQASGYLEALKDVESILTNDEGVLVFGDGASRTFFTNAEIEEARIAAHKLR